MKATNDPAPPARGPGRWCDRGAFPVVDEEVWGGAGRFGSSLRRTGRWTHRAIPQVECRAEVLVEGDRRAIGRPRGRAFVPPVTSGRRPDLPARSVGSPAGPGAGARGAGVDEFAFRKGRTYGTILVNVETTRVVDVLPDRTSETFAAWLREHPGAEIICRDRASTYSRVVKKAGPARYRGGRSLAPAAEPVSCSGEDVPSAPSLRAEIRGRGSRGPAQDAAARRAAAHADHRSGPTTIRGGQPPGRHQLPAQRSCPAARPGPQDRPPLPRHRSRNLDRLSP
ncbi:transposase [Wenjunlia tyrosinilytica]|uniref:transposase n=1 Tax=Wenjunlia tyrosinilytica TaxID=1544741 RepID=UPI003570CF30